MAYAPVPGVPSSDPHLPISETQLAGDGTTLAVWHWPCTQPSAKGALFICHGVGEHGRRYDHVAMSAAEQGWDVWYWDHRGHGASSGVRGHVGSFSEYVEDFKLLVETRASAHKKKAVIGHSMGGLITAQYLLRYPGDFPKAVLSAPALGVTTKIPVVKALAGRLLSNLLPSMTLANEIDTALLCTDPAVVSAYEKDSLVHDRVSARWFTEFMAAIDDTRDRADGLQVPTAIWCGTEDLIVSQDACVQFAAKAGSAIATYKPLSGLKHEILNEPKWQELLKEMLDWLES